ncbi:MAG TPA: hypothetical protein RMF84_00155, partial [Polyangiaceae bacterium LLY-WYZ-14_1]|nr:hypothetical protein [Polyangiaceae bacterium LLY-WYZ-14_1]
EQPGTRAPAPGEAVAVRHPVLAPFASCDDVTGNDAMIADTPFLSAREPALSGTYRVQGRQVFDGANMTIAPGTTFIMEADAAIHFTWGCSTGTTRWKVTMVGTEDAPIRFCPSGDRKGHWKTLEFHCPAEGSAMAWVHVEGGGGRDGSTALTLGGPLPLQHVEVLRSKHLGVSANVFAPDSGPLLVAEGDGRPLRLGADAISTLPPGDYQRNRDPVAEVQQFAGRQVVFHDRGVPYLQLERRVPMGGNDSATFEAGVEYRFCEGCFLYTGWRNDRTTLRVEGTAERPVVFQGAQGDVGPSGFWNGLSVLYGTTSDSFIRHAIIRDAGGGGEPALTIGSPITVEHLRIEDAAGVPLVVGRGAEAVEGGGNVFARNGAAFEGELPSFAYENVAVGQTMEPGQSVRQRGSGTMAGSAGTAPDPAAGPSIPSGNRLVILVEDRTSGSCGCDEVVDELSSSGPDLVFARLTDSTGTLVDYGDVVEWAEGSGEPGYLGGSLIDGNPPNINASDPRCPADGFSPQSILSLGCAGYVIVAFDLPAGGLVGGGTIAVSEYGEFCANGGPDALGSEVYQIFLCTDPAGAFGRKDRTSCTVPLGGFHRGWAEVAVGGG